VDASVDCDDSIIEELFALFTVAIQAGAAI